MRKWLTDILREIVILEIVGDVYVEIDNVSFDSKDIKNNTLFVATRGTNIDAHNFIPDAINNGSVAIVCEKFPNELFNNIAYVKVNNSSVALGYICSNFYDNPSRKLKLIGITGTNGKTTIATLLYNLFTKLGYKVGLLSTICNKISTDIIPSTHTTPDTVILNKLLVIMVDRGCEYCFMEVSSHAIIQNRIAGLYFAGGIFTNLTHDHLDYHKTFGNYISAKKSFFDNLTDNAFALTNIDDKNGKLMLQNTKARKFTYSLKSKADFSTIILENNFGGLKLQIDSFEIWCRLIGNFNAYNITAVYATALIAGQKAEEVLSIISNLDAIEGRFEWFKDKNNVIAIVDYAHTPDAIKKVLTTISAIKKHNEKIITVIGAGGDRDKAKRPEMADISVKKSDRVILTSDNPRTEDPAIIIKEMCHGISDKDMRKAISIIDRKEAIKAAYSLAQPGDIILIAGKGHEKYQEIKGLRYSFDDKQIIKELMSI